MLIGLGNNLTSEDVYNLAMKGDPRANEIFVSMGRYLGIALATLINAFNFPLYLLGGGVLGAWNLFAPPMIRRDQAAVVYVSRHQYPRGKGGIGK